MCQNHKVTGLMLLLATAVFARVETNHFGNNWLPSSYAELGCDIIVLLLLCISLRIMFGAGGKNTDNL